MIINSGIRKIIVEEGYPDDLAVEMLGEAGLKIVTINHEEAI
jgi:dCMP deaminase